MSKRNILTSMAIASALFAAPAFADGKVTRTVKGPTPLKAQPYCASGKGYYDTQGRFVCPVITKTPTRTYTPAPIRTYTPAPIQVAAAPQYDFSGMTGGVGSSVGSGFYGGGGGFVLSSGTKSYSGVLSARASALTFNRRVKHHRPPPMPPMPMGGCGCGGD